MPGSQSTPTTTPATTNTDYSTLSESELVDAMVQRGKNRCTKNGMIEWLEKFDAEAAEMEAEQQRVEEERRRQEEADSAKAAVLAALKQANALSMEIYRECGAIKTQKLAKNKSCRFVKAGDVNVSDADPAVGQCRPSTIGLCEKCAGAVGYCSNRHTCGKCFGQGMTITDVTECSTYEQTGQPAPARTVDGAR